MVQLDIPMPKTCYECPCHDGENNSCQVTGKYCYDEILRSCPLIELPSAEPERKKEAVTPKEFKTLMKKIAIEHDPETFHEYADDLMCTVLNGLGYEDGVKIFQDTEKWYS